MGFSSMAERPFKAIKDFLKWDLASTNKKRQMRVGGNTKKYNRGEYKEVRHSEIVREMELAHLDFNICPNDFIMELNFHNETNLYI